MAGKPLKAGATAASLVTKGSALGGTKAVKRSPKGRLFPAAVLLGAQFRSSLAKALGTASLKALGVTSEAQLRRALIEAHKRLGKSSVTAPDWLGRVLEVVGPTLPVVIKREAEVVALLAHLVNTRITSGKVGRALIDCLGKVVKPNKPFTKRRVIYNTKIRLPARKGVDYVDRANLLSNTDGQALFLSMEFKARGAAGELPGQMAKRDTRLEDAAKVPGAELVYNVEGVDGEFTTKLADLVFLETVDNPLLKGTEAALSRLGVVAGDESRVTIALDSSGQPYVRIVVPIATDVVRKILERLLRDRSWQA